jgi:hypothetical protein
MLYSDPLEEINWEAVEQFCAGRIPESAFIDYKAEWPNDLAKTIAAMANTLGGVILIGVQTDTQEMPVTPIAGVPQEPRLELRVFDICESAIFPPVIPEVKACLNAESSRAVLLIRVPISRQAHAVERNTRVYVRTGNRNSPNELADISKIEWLLGIRGKLELQRENIVQRAREHFRPLIVHALGQTAVSDDFFLRHWLGMYAVPTFPSKELVRTAIDTRRLATETVQITEEHGAQFPWNIGVAHGRHVQDGYASAAVTIHDPKNGCYHEINSHGLYFYKERVGRESQIQGVELLWSDLIARRLHSFLCGTQRLYAAVGYHGPIEIEVSLKGINGLGDLRFIPPQMTVTEALQRFWCPDQDITVPWQTNTIDLGTDIVDITISILTRINRAFGYGKELAGYRQEIATRDQNIRG